MKKSITLSVDEDVYEKFCLAMNLTKDSKEIAIENCMRWYIAKTFGKASQEYNIKTTIKTSKEGNLDFYGKAIHRIPLWAIKPDQYNHKIIRAYFKCLKTIGRATVDDMERLCSDRDVPKLYVPTFRSNYSQMKLDGPKSHGKIFEDDGETVTIWHEVEDTLMRYKSSFCD
jgi:hypothetical protein